MSVGVYTASTRALDWDSMITSADILAMQHRCHNCIFYGFIELSKILHLVPP